MSNKLSKVLIFCVLLSVVATAEHKVAVGLDGLITNSSNSSSSSSLDYNWLVQTTTNDSKTRYFLLSPRVSIMASEIVEVNPSISFGRLKSTSEYTSASSGSESNLYTQGIFGFGVGTNFHVIRNEVFHLSMGPRIGMTFWGTPDRETESEGIKVEVNGDDYYESHSEIDFKLSIPLNCDFHIGETFGVRLSFELLSTGIHKTTYTLKDVSKENENKDSYFNVFGSNLNIEGDNYPVSAAFPTLGIFGRF